MKVIPYKPDRYTTLMKACVYATTLAKKENCIVEMDWAGIKFSCNPNITAAKFYDLINFNLKRKV